MEDKFYIELIQALLNTCHISRDAMIILVNKLLDEGKLNDFSELKAWITSLYPTVSHEAPSIQT